jgi:competence protein ComEC
VTDDNRLHIPAAYPLLAYVAGLTGAPLAINPKILFWGSIAMSLLVLCAGRRRLALTVMLFAGGTGISLHNLAATNEDLQTVGAFENDRFLVVEAPIQHGWRRVSGERHLLVTSSFSVEGLAVGLPLVISTSADPPGIGNDAVVVAEGFLSRSGETCRLSVKSARLIGYRGTLSPFTPAGLNRRMHNALMRFAEEQPRYARAAVLSGALALGRSEHLPEDVRESYRKGGIYHLLVFSGLQIALAAAALGWLFRLIRAPRAGDFVLLALSFAAPAFAGNEPSVSRSSWMIGLYALSRILRRPTRIENLLFVSALIRLIAHPGEIDDASFALTYAATGGLILAGRSMAAGIRSRLLSALIYGAGAELATLPLTLLLFHQYVAAGSLVTLLASPLVTAMLALAAVACVCVLLAPAALPFVLGPVGLLDAVCGWMTSAVSDRLHLSGLAAAPPAFTIIASFTLLIALMPLLGKKGRAAASLILLPLPVLWSAVATLHRSTVADPTIEFLDVGQGDATVIRRGNGVVLIDGGGRVDDSRYGRSLFVPALLDRGIRRIDTAAVTHPDPDHCGGVVAAIEHLQVSEVWLSSRHAASICAEQLERAAIGRGTSIVFVDKLHGAERIGLPFEINSGRLRFKRSPANNSSLVFRVRADQRSVLITGDIEKDAERLFSDELPDRMCADVLKVSHHGSRSSSNTPFLEAVGARVAVISCGRKNRFGHPAEEVLSRLERHAVVVRTDLSGSVRITIREGRVMVTREIDTPRRGD